MYFEKIFLAFVFNQDIVLVCGSHELKSIFFCCLMLIRLFN